MTTLHIARESFKFSCAHMTVFPDGSKERLHGHNYMASIDIVLRDSRFENMVDFNVFKTALTSLCGEWKEHLLLARDNPHFEVHRDDASLEFSLCEQRYLVPRADALILPIDNVSTEKLAQLLCTAMLETCEAHLRSQHVESVTLRVEESPGQGASYCHRF